MPFLSLDQFSYNYGMLQPGQGFCYHIGHLAEDRLMNRTISDIAIAAWSLWKHGHAELVQEKLGNRFLYSVIKRRQRYRPTPRELIAKGQILK